MFMDNREFSVLIFSSPIMILDTVQTVLATLSSYYLQLP